MMTHVLAAAFELEVSTAPGKAYFKKSVTGCTLGMVPDSKIACVRRGHIRVRGGSLSWHPGMVTAYL